ncbi:hypothetical protein ACFL6S_36700, partial [Candidatus Poribacteria bacterium]
YWTYLLQQLEMPKSNPMELVCYIGERFYGYSTAEKNNALLKQYSYLLSILLIPNPRSPIYSHLESDASVKWSNMVDAQTMVDL